MTDAPRFETLKGPPAELHLHYHGGPVVELVFRLVDASRGWVAACDPFYAFTTAGPKLTRNRDGP